MKVFVAALVLTVPSIAYANGKNNRPSHPPKHDVPICVAHIDNDEDDDNDDGKPDNVVMYRTRWVKEKQVERIFARKPGSCRLDAETAPKKRKPCACGPDTKVFAVSQALGVSLSWKKAISFSTDSAIVDQFQEAWDAGFTKVHAEAVATPLATPSTACELSNQDGSSSLTLPVKMDATGLTIFQNLGPQAPPNEALFDAEVLSYEPMGVTMGISAAGAPVTLDNYSLVTCAAGSSGGMSVSISLSKP